MRWRDQEWHEPWGGRRWTSPNGREIALPDGDEPFELEVDTSDGERAWFHFARRAGTRVTAVKVNGRRYVPAPERDWDSEVCE